LGLLGDSRRIVLFLGEFEHTIDKQRRVAIPRTWREESMNLVIIPGRCKTLLAVSPEKAKEMMSKLTSGSFANPDIARAMTAIGSFSSSCVCDKQGRVPLTKKQMDYAGIVSDVVFVGAFDSMQIWSKENKEAQDLDIEDVLNVIQGIQEQPSDVDSALSSLFDKGK